MKIGKKSGFSWFFESLQKLYQLGRVIGLNPVGPARDRVAPGRFVVCRPSGRRKSSRRSRATRITSSLKSLASNAAILQFQFGNQGA
jgi:hypothetical protein